MDQFNRLLRFGVAGILATIFYFVLVNIIIKGFGADPVAASVIAYLSSLAISYLLQSRFTFRVRRDTPAQGIRFLITSLAGLAISYWAMLFFVRVLGLPYEVGSVAICILIPLANYIAFQNWVFLERRTEDRRLTDRT